ncbi:MAG: type II secretion system F family protein [Marmoricola sp.]
MGAVLGLLFGAGLILVLSVFVLPEQPVKPATTGRLRRSLDEAGLQSMRTATLVAACAGCALVALVAVQALSRTAPVALVFAVLASWAPLGVVSGRARRRRRELAQVWPEAVDHLSSAVRAGLSLPEALGGLAQRGPLVLRKPFAAFALDYQVSGRFADALDRLKDRLADPVGDQVVEALRVAREVGGGDLGRLLRNLSAFLREDARTRSELEARQAWTLNGARLAVAAPWFVLLLMCFQHAVVRRFATPAGVGVLVVGAVACGVAYRLMLRIGRLPVERRVLA